MTRRYTLMNADDVLKELTVIFSVAPVVNNRVYMSL